MRDLPTPTQPLIDALPSLSLGASSTRRGLHRAPDAPARDKPVLAISWARHQDEVTEAQRLRYKVFAEEMGAHLASAGTELDVDMFDAVCDHLIVRDQQTLRVVGTYRVLRPDAAKRIGCLYSNRNSTWCAWRTCVRRWSNWAAPACTATTVRAA